VHKVVHWPDRSARAAKFLGAASHCVSKRPHLTRRSRAPLRRFAADNPVHRRIVAQALGVVHVLISGNAAEHRLPQQTDQCVAAVPAGSRISECLARHRGQAEWHRRVRGMPTIPRRT